MAEEESEEEQDRENLDLSIPDFSEYKSVLEENSAFLVGLLVLTGLVGALMVVSDKDNSTKEKVDKDNMTELTQYQKDYVDCPAKYLDTCTKMSKIPTEEVSFWKTEGERMYLKMEDGRAIISTLPNGTAGEFVTIMSAAEVPNSTSK